MNGRFKGHHHTKESKELLRQSHLGKKLSYEHKKRISESQIGKRSGDNNPNWKGGLAKEAIKIRQSIEYRLWRNAVFARDNFTCQKCNEKGIYLVAHHVKNFAQCPELRFAIDNGISFCRNCHRNFHRGYGVKNNTLEQVELFLQGMI